jgi:hypothetical protein
LFLTVFFLEVLSGLIFGEEKLVDRFGDIAASITDITMIEDSNYKCLCNILLLYSKDCCTALLQT